MKMSRRIGGELLKDTRDYGVSLKSARLYVDLGDNKTAFDFDFDWEDVEALIDALERGGEERAKRVKRALVLANAVAALGEK